MRKNAYGQHITTGPKIDITNSVLIDANFENAKLMNATFENSNLIGANFHNSTFVYVDLFTSTYDESDTGNLSGANFTNSKLEYVKFNHRYDLSDLLNTRNFNLGTNFQDCHFIIDDEDVTNGIPFNFILANFKGSNINEAVRDTTRSTTRNSAQGDLNKSILDQTSNLLNVYNDSSPFTVFGNNLGKAMLRSERFLIDDDTEASGMGEGTTLGEMLTMIEGAGGQTLFDEILYEMTTTNDQKTTKLIELAVSKYELFKKIVEFEIENGIDNSDNIELLEYMKFLHLTNLHTRNRIINLSSGLIFDLSNIDLTDANLPGAYLAGANLREANLTGANLDTADLTGADLTGATLTDVYLIDTDLTGADLTGANLSEADLTNANLSFAILTGANLTKANFTGADLSFANLDGSNLTKANLTGANFMGAFLYDTNFTGATLTGTDFMESRMKQSDFNKIKSRLSDPQKNSITIDIDPQ